MLNTKSEIENILSKQKCLNVNLIEIPNLINKLVENMNNNPSPNNLLQTELCITVCTWLIEQIGDTIENAIISTN